MKFGKIEPAKLRDDILQAATSALMERSKRYTANGLPRHVPIAYSSLATHLVSVAESTSEQMAAKTNGDAHTALTWLCIMLGPQFEKEIFRLQSKLAPGREL